MFNETASQNDDWQAESGWRTRRKKGLARPREVPYIPPVPALHWQGRWGWSMSISRNWWCSVQQHYELESDDSDLHSDAEEERRGVLDQARRLHDQNVYEEDWPEDDGTVYVSSPFVSERSFFMGAPDYIEPCLRAQDPYFIRERGAKLAQKKRAYLKHDRSKGRRHRYSAGRSGADKNTHLGRVKRNVPGSRKAGTRGAREMPNNGSSRCIKGCREKSRGTRQEGLELEGTRYLKEFRLSNDQFELHDLEESEDSSDDDATILLVENG